MRDRNVTVFEKERPEFAATGVRAGQFIFKPRLDVGLAYTTNAYGISDVPRSFGLESFEDEPDTVFLVRPSIRFDSLWSNHALSGGAYVETFSNERFNAETRANYGAFVEGQIDVARGIAAFATLSADRQHETRLATSRSLLTTGPVKYDLAKFRMGLRHEIGRVKSRIEAAISNFNYFDEIPVGLGGVSEDLSEDQDFRDRTRYSVLGKVSFAISRDTSIFFAPSYNTQNYGLDSPIDRDSEGWDAQVGVDFDLTRLLRGSISVGRFQQNFDNPQFEDAEGTSVNAILEWFPRERTNLALQLRRGADVSSFQSLGGAITTELLVRAEQEIRHNLIGYIEGGYGTIEYEDLIATDTGNVDQDIERTRAGLGLTYYHSRMLESSLSYTFQTQDADPDALSGGIDFNYDVHEVMLTVSLKR